MQSILGRQEKIEGRQLSSTEIIKKADDICEQVKKIQEEKKKKEKNLEKLKIEVKQYQDTLEAAIEHKLVMEKTVKDQQEHIIQIEEINKKLEIEVQDLKTKGKALQENRKTEENGTDKEKSRRFQQKTKENNNIIENNATDEGENSLHQQKVCINFVKYGQCRYGGNCRYQHKNICRSVVTNTACKNVICRFSHDETGFCRREANRMCSYGERCKYIHRGDMRRRQINHNHKQNTWMEGDERNQQSSKYYQSEQRWYGKQGSSHGMRQMQYEDTGKFGYREDTGRQNQNRYEQIKYCKEREQQMTKHNDEHNDEAVTKRQENDTERRREWKEYQDELIKVMKEHMKEETDKLRDEMMRQRENFLLPQQPVMYQMHPNIHPNAYG
eukprot:Seg3606.2 transcript_id=Seg3606.2/GoldUCD/mRNA.D3Y31 product="hypothetical protein" protein_id=Seg3606.2/GoldUCD/D3Y31